MAINECEWWFGSSGRVNTQCGHVAVLDTHSKRCPFCDEKVYMSRTGADTEYITSHNLSSADAARKNLHVRG